MLAKQGWNLLSKPNALVSRIFKAKYFPRGGFLTASVGHNPSYTWRSIWTAQALVKEGCKWRVGTGRTISVWGEPWLRNHEFPMIRTPAVGNANDWTIINLMNEGNQSWNINLLQQLFCLEDIQEILQIPLRSIEEEDLRIWRWTKNGDFTVRSAYHHLKETMLLAENLTVEGEWRKLWQLELPPRIKAFLWRLCRNCIPTKSRLNQKGVECSSLCLFCNNHIETDLHLFFGCDFAKSIWQETNLWNLIQGLMNNAANSSHIFFQALNSQSTRQSQLFAMILDSIWCCRNELLWEGKKRNKQQTVIRAKQALLDWQKARIHNSHNNALPRSPQQSVTWIPPITGFLKCNIDAAFFKEELSFGYGFCLRDETGQFMQAKTSTTPFLPLVQEGEALALLEAIKWLTSLEIDHVMIESDSLSVVQALKNPTADLSEFGSIISHCRSLLASLPNYNVSYIRRQANIVAHTLAWVAMDYASHQVFYHIPTCIEDQVMNEIL